MNYERIYFELINKAKGREIIAKQYYEKHHILPKCMGGNNSLENIVKLTYREHILAHWMLYRIYPTNRSLANAFHIMIFGRLRKRNESAKVISLRVLQEAKEAKVNARKGTFHKDSTRQKMKGKRGRLKVKRAPTSEETRNKMRLAKLGRKRSDEVCQAISDGKKLFTPSGEGHHRFGAKHSEETINKMKLKRNARIKKAII